MFELALKLDILPHSGNSICCHSATRYIAFGDKNRGNGDFVHIQLTRGLTVLCVRRPERYAVDERNQSVPYPFFLYSLGVFPVCFLKTLEK